MPPKAGIPVSDPQYKNLIALGRLKFIETGAGAPTHFRAIESAYFDSTNLELYVNAGGGSIWTKIGPTADGGGSAGFSAIGISIPNQTLTTTFTNLITVDVSLPVADTYLIIGILSVACVSPTTGSVTQANARIVGDVGGVLSTDNLIMARGQWAAEDRYAVPRVWRIVTTGPETVRLQGSRSGTSGILRSIFGTEIVAFSVGGGSGGVANHNIISTEHPDTAGTPVDGELLRRSGGNWIPEQPDQHGDHHLRLDNMPADIGIANAGLGGEIQVSGGAGIATLGIGAGLFIGHIAVPDGDLHTEYQEESEKNALGGYGPERMQSGIFVAGTQSV